MRTSHLFGATLAAALGIWPVTGQIAEAVQLRDGTVYFVQVPQLLEATTTYRNTGMTLATYYFTISVPTDAGEPLQRVLLNQHLGPDDVRFEMEDIRAFEGTRWRRGTAVGLTNVDVDRDERTVSVSFNPPIQPGKTVTIALRPFRNPSFEGVYLFGVTAFPRGEKAHGQFLGYGRLHFYNYRDW